MEYHWSLTKTALIFGTLIGFLWDGLQGGMIEVATFKMPAVVVFVDSSYHTLEGTLAAWMLSLFYRKFVVTA
jgi:cell shape-determining protein MreD